MNERRDQYTGSSSAGTTTTTYSWYRRAHSGNFIGGWWWLIDTFGHKLRLPRWLMRPICDRYDIACGIPREHLIKSDYAGRKVPWWLRR